MTNLATTKWAMNTSGMNKSGRAASGLGKFMYRVGEGAGLAAVLVSILLWASIADACFH